MAKVSEYCARVWSRLSGLARHDYKRPWIGRVFAGLAIFGVFVLAFMLGAAWMYCELPGSNLLDRALVGGTAFMQRGRGAAPTNFAGARTPTPGVTRDRRGKTFDGFTLITTTNDSAAQLVDMEGRTVHRWGLPFSKAMPKPNRANPLGDAKVHWFCSHLFGNGDLLVVYQSEADTPPGYGLVKLDKDSQVLWRCESYVHHSVDVGADGKIYTLTSQTSSETRGGLEWIPTPYLDEYLLILSPEGKELHKISLLEAFRDSPFALTLALTYMVPAHDSPMALPGAGAKQGSPQDDAATDGPGKGGKRTRTVSRFATARGDILHSNSVQVLNPGLASKFPMLQANQVLISLRNSSTVAALDVQKRAVTWSAQGIWKAQHSPQFLENGRLLIYDNNGAPKGTRVLEFDPRTGASPWSYANEDGASFNAQARGTAQRLPNGNTLIVDPEGMRIFEVTNDKEMVWELGCQRPSEVEDEFTLGSVTHARRYAPAQLTFLKGDVRARP